MVCKNCGADLKPGIKYCLECGNYIDDDITGSEEGSVGSIGDTPSYTFKDTGAPARRKKKKKMSTTDILIYAALVLVIIVSIIVIIISVINSNKSDPEPSEPVVRDDITLAIDDYKVTVPGEYLYDVEGDILYVSDDVNYTFSYRNTTDDYDLYADDLEVVTKELESNKYEVYSAEKKTVSNTDFLCYKLKANGSVKYLYLTKASSYYTSLGVIEVFNNGDWEKALPVIAELNRSIVFTRTPSIKKDKDDDDEVESETTTTTTVTEEVSEIVGSLIDGMK